MERPQQYANHRAWPKPTFALAVLVLVANAVVAAVQLVRAPGLASAWALAVAAAIAVVALAARRLPQIVQDRSIRDTMRLRLRHVLPSERHADIARLSLPQLVALRFAPDAELPALVEGALGGRLATADDIKRAIRDWQADRLRV